MDVSDFLSITLRAGCSSPAAIVSTTVQTHQVGRSCFVVQFSHLNAQLGALFQIVLVDIFLKSDLVKDPAG